jgi:hypothetical protein
MKTTLIILRLIYLLLVFPIGVVILPVNAALVIISIFLPFKLDLVFLIDWIELGDDWFKRQTRLERVKEKIKSNIQKTEVKQPVQGKLF